jgi:hypothetical protein
MSESGDISKPTTRRSRNPKDYDPVGQAMREFRETGKEPPPMNLETASCREDFPRRMRDLAAQQSGGKGDKPLHLRNKRTYDHFYDKLDWGNYKKESTDESDT